MEIAEWIRRSDCRVKICDRLRENTVLKNYPLYCSKCKQETLRVIVSRSRLK